MGVDYRLQVRGSVGALRVVLQIDLRDGRRWRTDTVLGKVKSYEEAKALVDRLHREEHYPVGCLGLEIPDKDYLAP
ncbi:MAG: hypothetical protein WCK01_03205 [Candidatus Uhrbacteria bacterium]